MKKISILSAMTVICFAFLFTSCGSSDDQAQVQTASAETTAVAPAKVVDTTLLFTPVIFGFSEMEVQELPKGEGATEDLHFKEVKYSLFFKCDTLTNSASFRADIEERDHYEGESGTSPNYSARGVIKFHQELANLKASDFSLVLHQVGEKFTFEQVILKEKWEGNKVTPEKLIWIKSN